MSEATKELDLLRKALESVREARSIQAAMKLSDDANAIGRIREQADNSRELIDEASVVRLFAERRLGELLKQTQLAKAAPGNQYTGTLDRSQDTTSPMCLRDLGITKSRSSRAQKLAELPQEAFDNYISDKVNTGEQPTIAAALKLQKQHEAAQLASPPEDTPTGFVTSLQSLLDEGRRYSTIVADPPWRHDNQASRASTSNHYPTMTLEEICSEPIAALAAKNCHLHLWATSPLLPEALTVISACGFEYKGTFVWVKPQMGMGNYWRISHEILLLGIRGKLEFQDHSQRSWIEADRTKHSEKPEEIRELIEKVNPGPYLEMYGRKPPVNSAWTVYGNEIVSEE